MNILVISDLSPYVTGGAEIQSTRLINAWLDQENDVICFGRRMPEDKLTKIGNHTIKIRRINTSNVAGRLGRAISYSLSLSSLLLKYRNWPDVIYCRFLGDAALTVSALKQLRLLQTPLIATPASIGHGDIQFLHTIPGTGILINLLKKQCDAINLIAPGMKCDLLEAGFQEKSFHYIPNGITISPLIHRTTDQPIRFVAVGRLSSEKGYDLLLRAVSQLSDRLEPHQITIVGSGPEENRLHHLAETLEISNLIRWTGELNQTEVMDILDLSDVFLLPSLWEGLSNAALEAMERALALIVSSCGGIDTYIDRNTGWVIPKNNVNELARAMTEAMTLPPSKIREMGNKARELILTDFDMSKIASRYLELFYSFQHQAD